MQFGIYTMFKNYNEKLEEIRQLNVPFKKKALYFAFSLMLAIISVSGLMCIAINLFLFRDFQKILGFLIATFIVIIYLIYEVLYLKCLTNKQINGLSVIYVTNTFIVSIIVYMALILLFFMGVL